MKAPVQGTCWLRDSQINRENLIHPWYDTAILAANPAEEELADSSGTFRHDCQDVCHSSPPPRKRPTGRADGSRNPFPDPSTWATIENPSERLVSALKELFSWYRRKENMLGKIFRDAPALPPLQEVMNDLWSPYVEALVGTLAHGWPVRRADAEALQAALRLVVGFDTWRVLTGSGFDDGRAAELAARMIAGAFGP